MLFNLSEFNLSNNFQKILKNQLSHLLEYTELFVQISIKKITLEMILEVISLYEIKSNF